MQYLISEDARYLFPDDSGVGYEEPVLIRASVMKIYEIWAKSSHGDSFINSQGGVEKPDKLKNASEWIACENEVWAPVIELRVNDSKSFYFAEGRHTFIALKNANFTCIDVAVRVSKQQDLLELFCCE